MTNTKSLPSVDYLRKRLRYEPETGKLFWLDYEGMPKGWRSRWKGKEAFTAEDNYGYRLGAINKQMFRAHRVSWAISYGEWPSDHIDHINGVRGDNRIINLRVASYQENNKNASMQSNNTSGITGVCWAKWRSKWHARIMVNRRQLHLGYFDTLEEAAEVYKEAAIKHGFTERHGTKGEEVE
jgi:hypothetical protein